MLKLQPSNQLVIELKRLAHKYVRNRKAIFLRPDVKEIDESVERGLNDKTIKHRQHPGRYSLGAVRPPTKFEFSLLNSSADVALQMLKKPAVDLYNYLNHRCFSMPENVMESRFYEIRRQIVGELRQQRRQEKFGETDQEIDIYIESISNRIDKTTKNRLKKEYREWQPIDYNSTAKCLTYALARFAPDFAILRRILHEIHLRQPDFVPESLFDFGSGVGSVLWAVDETWPKSVKEYFCVDTCDSMLQTMNLLLCNGEPQGPCLFDANVYRRRFLPADQNVQYDMVVSAFSLMEIPSYVERLRTIATLWEKTKHFLILVENGNRYGFTTIVEARDYILAGGHEIWRKEMENLYKEGVLDPNDVKPILESKEMSESQKYELLQKRFAGDNIKLPTMFPVGHCYMPCPHDFGCPKLMDVLPCKFQQSYFPLRLVDFNQNQIKKEFFSYVVLKKGEVSQQSQRYHRIISRPTLATRSARCDLCTTNGHLADLVVSKRFDGKNLYRMTKSSDWGDVLPIKLTFDPTKSAENSLSSSKSSKGIVNNEENEDLSSDDEEENELLKKSNTRENEETKNEIPRISVA